MKGNWKLQLRLWFVMVLMFVLVYFVLILAANLLGYGGFYSIYAIIGLVVIFIQYLAGPKLVEMSMNVRYVSSKEAPYIHEMVEELAKEAGIPKPKVGVSDISVPNAFAYGRSKRSGHVCVTSGILGLLSRDELKAVLGHEIGHIKHNDMAITTVVSAVPMICYYVALSFLFSRNDNNNGLGLIVGIIGFAAYLVGQLLVLFVSRIREYYADAASVEFGNDPKHLASALYKLVYGAAKAPNDQIKEMSQSRAFFLNDIKDTNRDIRSLRQLDLDNDGTISGDELKYIRDSNVEIKTSEKTMELWSTHPNMLKRIKRLSKLQN